MNDDTKAMVKATLAASIFTAVAETDHGRIFDWHGGNPARDKDMEIFERVAGMTEALFVKLFPTEEMPEVQVGGNPRDVKVRTQAGK